MAKKIKCTITEEIVENTTFCSEICYAKQAMMNTDVIGIQNLRDIYWGQVTSLPSTCGNPSFGNDLVMLDYKKEHEDEHDYIRPTLPLTFEIEI